MAKLRTPSVWDSLRTAAQDFARGQPVYDAFRQKANYQRGKTPFWAVILVAAARLR